jgi:hypothetical protein
MQVNDKLHAPAALPPRERAPGTHWIGGWVGRYGEKKNLLPLPEIEPRLSSP